MNEKEATWSQKTTVQTNKGKVKGEYKDGLIVFNSIPFAKPPVGELRFKPAVAHDSWFWPKDVRKKAPACPQMRIIGGLFSGSEDCLYLHVTAPANAKTGTKLPVMFWIFGGGLNKHRHYCHRHYCHRQRLTHVPAHDLIACCHQMPGYTIGSPTEHGFYDAKHFAKKHNVVIVQARF